jgi:hypothetical protein
MTSELFIDVCRMLTKGTPLSMISRAWQSCSVVAWLSFSLMRRKAVFEREGWTISTSSPASR